MPTREQRTLRSVKTTAGPAANRPRRAVVRRLPSQQDDPLVLLAHLDEEPVLSDPPAARRRRLPLIAALVAVVAMLGAAAFAGHAWYSDRTLEQAHQRALAAARQTAVNFVSISSSSVDRDLQRIVAGSTGEFKEEFQRGQAEVRSAVVENKVESRGTLLRAGLVSGDRRSATVLAAVDATVKNVKAPDGRASHYRIQLDLTKDAKSGDWLVSKLQFVG